MMRLLKVGETVFIKRSDGRVHQAMISSINLEMEIVGVEWLEENESKGKEVDISTLLALNEDIIIRAEFAQCSSDVALDSNSKKRKSVAASQRNRIKSSKSRVTGNFDLELPKTRRSVKEKYPRPTRSVIENINSSMDSSNVVKKVGKMEQERLERRRKQAENRAEKMELSRRHADNPHWELCQAIAEHRKKIDFRPLTENDPIEDRLITVCVRKRPINRSERSKKEVDVITVPSKNQLLVHEPKVKVDLTKYLENHVFKFDYTFGEDCSNETVYKFTAQPLIKTIFEKGFATCFAYGQTGSGKTFTMSGDLSKDTRSGKGIYAMAATDIFMLVNSHQYKELNLVVTCSFFEIYSRKVLDLLNNKAELKILEDGKQQVQVVGLTEKVVGSVDDVLELIHQGNTSRTSGQTSANENSSRSHAVFQIYLRPSKQMNMLHGKLSLIDLAGNERGADTLSSTKVVRMEGGEINKSLLALKECIRALGRKGSHLPFRLSKLTQVLRDSFIGNNSKTCMIAMISPGMSSCENTLNTLRYADRVKELCGGDLQLTTISEKCDDIIRIDDTDDETQYDCEEDQELDDNESINEAKFAKERMLAYHQDTLLRLHEFNQKAKYLLKSFDTDQEEYCKNFESLLDNAVAFLLNVKNSVIQHKEWVTRS